MDPRSRTTSSEREAPRRGRAIRFLVIAIAILIAGVMLPPLIHLGITAWRDRRDDLPHPSRTSADDASHLNATVVGTTIDLAADDEGAIRQIRAAFERARREHLQVSIAGARHSMGGQTIAPTGIVLNILPHDHLKYDYKTRDVIVGSGATWDLIIPYLDHFGRAVEVMQSDSPFTVGGSISVNCHGWQARHAPISSTVVAFSIVTPDGRVLHCSRTENATLFANVLGGYGLFGIVLDVELRTVPNELYERHTSTFDAAQYDARFRSEVENRHAALAYGRLSITPEHFLDQAILTTFTSVKGQPKGLRWHESSRMERLLFRGSLRSDYGKRLRWWAERHLAPIFYPRVESRNEIMDGDTAVYLNRSAAERDILHEYFVPREKFASFVRDVRVIVRRHHLELLNATVRDVRRDDDTTMRYAERDVFAVVLFFSQRPTSADERAMRDATRELIDAAIKNGGKYYLPYRLHATSAQFRAAYPRCTEFFEAKNAVDPDGLLQNQWSRTYAPACSR